VLDQFASVRDTFEGRWGWSSHSWGHPFIPSKLGRVGSPSFAGKRVELPYEIYIDTTAHGSRDDELSAVFHRKKVIDSSSHKPFKRILSPMQGLLKYWRYPLYSSECCRHRVGAAFWMFFGGSPARSSSLLHVTVKSRCLRILSNSEDKTASNDWCTARIPPSWQFWLYAR